METTHNDSQMIADLKDILHLLYDNANQAYAELERCEQNTELLMQEKQEIEAEVEKWQNRYTELMQAMDTQSQESRKQFAEQQERHVDEIHRQNRPIHEELVTLGRLKDEALKKSQTLNEKEQELTKIEKKLKEEKASFYTEKERYDAAQESNKEKLAKYESLANENYRLFGEKKALIEKIEALEKKKSELESECTVLKTEKDGEAERRRELQRKLDEAEQKIRELEHPEDSIGKPESSRQQEE